MKKFADPWVKSGAVSSNLGGWALQFGSPFSLASANASWAIWFAWRWIVRQWLFGQVFSLHLPGMGPQGI